MTYDQMARQVRNTTMETFSNDTLRRDSGCRNAYALNGYKRECHKCVRATQQRAPALPCNTIFSLSRKNSLVLAPLLLSHDCSTRLAEACASLTALRPARPLQHIECQIAFQ